MNGVLIEARGNDRYRVTGLDGSSLDVAGAENALALAEGIRAAWEKAKHPRARGGLFASVPDHSAPPKPKGRPMPRVIDHTGPRPGSVPDRTGLRAAPRDVPASKLKNRVDPEKDLPAAPPKGKETAPAEPLGSPGRPVETDDVVEAAKQLAAGKYVQLRSKNEVTVLLRELQKEVQGARDKGEKAPDINLCKVTVKGTSLFCVESKGVPRIQMPQLKGDATKARSGSKASKLAPDKRGEVSIESQFRDHLVRHGVAVDDGEELASHLKATQNELNGAKVAGIADAMERGVKIEGPGLFVSRDNYVVDGHHRWAATVGVDYADGKDDLKMPVQKIDMDIIDILLEANRFAEDWGLPQASLGDFSAKMLSGLEGAPPPLGSDAKEEPKREAQRTQQGKWRAEMPDGRRLDFASRELAEGALRREWEKIKHPRGRAGRFRDVPGSGAEKAKLTDALALGRGRSALFSPGRAKPAARDRAADAIAGLADHALDWLNPGGPGAAGAGSRKRGGWAGRNLGLPPGTPPPFSPGRAETPGRQADLRNEIARVLASTDPHLGMSPEAAARLRDKIGDADLGDDDALRAYDLLHARATPSIGRAFSPGRATPASEQNFSRRPSSGYRPTGGRPGPAHYGDPGLSTPGGHDRPERLDSPGRARVPSVKHAMGFEPGDYLVPTRHFSVDSGPYDPTIGGREKAKLLKGRRYKVKQIIGTNQLTVEHPSGERGAELLIPTFDKSSVSRERQQPSSDFRFTAPNASDDWKTRGTPMVGDIMSHPEYGRVEVISRPDAQGTDRPDKMLVRVRSGGQDRLVNNGDLSRLPKRVGSPALDAQRVPHSPGRAEGGHVPIESIRVGDTVHFDGFMGSPPSSAKVVKITRHREEIGGVNQMTRVAHFDDGSTFPIATYDDGREHPDGGFGQGEMTPRPSGQTERVTRGEPLASPGRAMDDERFRAARAARDRDLFGEDFAAPLGSPGSAYDPNPEGEPGMMDLPDLSPADRLPILYDAAMDAEDVESERYDPERAKRLWRAYAREKRNAAERGA